MFSRAPTLVTASLRCNVKPSPRNSFITIHATPRRQYTRSARHSFLSFGTSQRWTPVQTCDASALSTFKTDVVDASLPILIPKHVITVRASETWLRPKPSSTTTSAEEPILELNTEYLSRYSSSVHLPCELRAKDIFQRAEAVPLSFFIEHNPSTTANSDSTRLYIAQAPLENLPPNLQDDFETPDLVVDSSSHGHGGIYSSSLWLGYPPTHTPLHSDPNHNIFVQLAGRKVVRIVPPDVGDNLRAGLGVAEMGLSPEDMLHEGVEGVVWEDKAAKDGSKVEGFEATLSPGDAIFLPKGWWHSIKGYGEDINMSVNWWFQ